MTRLLMAGWETGDVNQIGAVSGGANPTVVSATPAARSGTYSLKCVPSSNAGGQFSRLTIQHTSKAELFYAFGLYRSNATEPAAGPSNGCFWVQDTAANGNVILTCEQDGTVRAYVQTTANQSTATLIAACPSQVPLTTWTLIEIHLVASTTTTGVCEVKMNGVLQFSATSQRTCQSNANFGNVILHFNRISTNVGSASSYYAFDDLRVNDTLGSVNNGWLGDGSIRALIPNGAGATIGGTPLSGVPGGPNWGNVDELPPSTADYNAGTTVGTGEMYALTDPPTLSSCQAVNIIVQALNSDAGGGSIGITLNSGGSNNEGAAVPISSSVVYYNRLLETDPSDGTAWSMGKLTNLQAGITVR